MSEITNHKSGVKLSLKSSFQLQRHLKIIPLGWII